MKRLPERSPADAAIAEIVAVLVERGKKPGDAKVLIGALLAQMTVDELGELVAPSRTTK